MIERLKLPLNKLKPNDTNPRFIREDEFQELYESIVEFPEMAEAKEIVVNKDYVILGGNMRYHAMQKAGWDEATVIIVDWPEDKQKEFIIRDNTHSGDWDYDKLAEKWKIEDAVNWGIRTDRWDIKSQTQAQPEDPNDYLEPEHVTYTCPYCGTENEKE